MQQITDVTAPKPLWRQKKQIRLLSLKEYLLEYDVFQVFPVPV
jgi:hypothetical protein